MFADQILLAGIIHFMHELKAKLEETAEQIASGIKTVGLDKMRESLANLNVEMQKSDFWNDNVKAQAVSQEASHLQKTLQSWEDIKREADELMEMLTDIDADKSPQEAAEFQQMCEMFFENWRKLEISTFLNGKYDRNSAIFSIHAGTGGKDAQDWAEMLLRMYMRYAEKNGFQVSVMDKSEGEEVGIKSVTLEIAGLFAYGYLKGEAGVHRLVRLSPFNAKNSRETSFALVEILPELNEEQEIEIKKEDLRIDVYRSSGKGGQSVNTTDSAVRITHLPTGIVVACQNERSQLQNKEQCLKILSAKLLDLMEKQQAAHLDELKGGKIEMSWGNQIRSYVLQPYKMVKDHRSGYEEGQVDKVLDGEIEGFIEAELKADRT